MIKVRVVEEDDFIPLAELLPLGFPTTTREFWLEQFSLWWAKNPAYTIGIPRGWVLDNDTRIVGFLGNIPVRYRIRGSLGIAAASNSWYVEPPFRGFYSLRLFMEFMKQNHVSLYLFKEEEDEPEVMKILARYKYTMHILPRSMKEYVYITNVRNLDILLVKFLFSGKVPELSDLSELYKRLGFLFFACLYQKPLTSPAVPKEEFVSSVCTHCDDSFFRLWEPFMQSCDTALSRDTETLNWLYFSQGRPNKRLVIQCRKTSDDSLAGYMVFEFIRKKPTDAGYMFLLDSCIADNDPRVLSSLLSFAIGVAHGENIAFLVAWADDEKTEAFLRRTFPLRRIARHYRFTRFPDTVQAVENEQNPAKVCPSMIYPPQ
jgi:hypothetical protein